MYLLSIQCFAIIVIVSRLLYNYRQLVDQRIIRTCYSICRHRHFKCLWFGSTSKKLLTLSTTHLFLNCLKNSLTQVYHIKITTTNHQKDTANPIISFKKGIFDILLKFGDACENILRTWITNNIKHLTFFSFWLVFYHSLKIIQHFESIWKHGNSKLKTGTLFIHYFLICKKLELS